MRMQRFNGVLSKILLVLLPVIVFFSGITTSFGKKVHVQGYHRKDGTYVSPHTRNYPDKSSYGDYSYSGKDKSEDNKVWVEGYHRKDGTYVKGHYRTKPDGDPTNNLSYRPKSDRKYSKGLDSNPLYTESEKGWVRTKLNPLKNVNGFEDFASRFAYKNKSVKKGAMYELELASDFHKIGILSEVSYRDNIEMKKGEYKKLQADLVITTKAGYKTLVEVKNYDHFSFSKVGRKGTQTFKKQVMKYMRAVNQGKANAATWIFSGTVGENVKKWMKEKADGSGIPIKIIENYHPGKMTPSK